MRKYDKTGKLLAIKARAGSGSQSGRFPAETPMSWDASKAASSMSRARIICHDSYLRGRILVFDMDTMDSSAAGAPMASR